MICLLMMRLSKWINDTYFTEENNAPADLSKKIIFRKTKAAETESDATATDKPVKKRAKREKRKVILSFNDEADDDNG